jgi:predicted  nucleic acid-binding Zn-ribbon protein
METRELIALLARMVARDTKADYSIGDYWNAVDEAHDALVELSEYMAVLKEDNAALRAELADIKAKHERLREAAWNLELQLSRIRPEFPLRNSNEYRDARVNLRAALEEKP